MKLMPKARLEAIVLRGRMTLKVEFFKTDVEEVKSIKLGDGVLKQ